MKALIEKLIAAAQVWSHAKVGWLGNKLALAFAALFTKAGVEAGDTPQVIAGAIVTILVALLELGVKVAGDKFVGRYQAQRGLRQDNWPGPKTRTLAGVE